MLFVEPIVLFMTIYMAFNPVSLFWFGWTADKGVHWLSPVIAAVPFAVGNIMVYSSGALYIMNSYGSQHCASALSANSLLRYAAGGAFLLFTAQMFSYLGIGWASSLLGFVSVALVPVPWVLYKYGKRIRAHSRYITIAEPVSGDSSVEVATEGVGRQEPKGRMEQSLWTCTDPALACVQARTRC